MKYWEECEEYVFKYSNGRKTPGSGNKNTKGDVRSKNTMFEVKSSEKSKITIQKKWLENLEKHQYDIGLALVLFTAKFEGFVYLPERAATNTELAIHSDWSTKSATKDTAPDFLIAGLYWVKYDLEIIKELP